MNQSSYENSEVICSSPAGISLRHSSPIPIQQPLQRMQQQPRFSTTSSPILPRTELTPPSTIVNVKYVVSLPSNAAENEVTSNKLNDSTESEVETQLSNSAPTTKSEMKTIRKVNRKLNRSELKIAQFGSYKEKWLPAALDDFSSIDNAVYECMRTDENPNYELMDEKRARLQSLDDSYYNNAIMAATSLSPALPPKTHLDPTVVAHPERTDDVYANQELIDTSKQSVKRAVPVPPRNEAGPVPPRTYRYESGDRPTTSSPSRIEPASDAYENLDLSQASVSPPPKPYCRPCEGLSNVLIRSSDGTSSGDCFALPPKTYRRTGDTYENTEMCCLDRNSCPTDVSYENHVLPGGAESPPPLPRKKLQRSQTERVSAEVKESIVEKLNLRLTIEPQACYSTDRRPDSSSDETRALIDIVSSSNGQQESKEVERDSSANSVRNSMHHNLIDDSPIDDKTLLSKYGSVWDGGEFFTEEKPNSGTGFVIKK